jgi:hypothetical protein
MRPSPFGLLTKLLLNDPMATGAQKELRPDPYRKQSLEPLTLK